MKRKSFWCLVAVVASGVFSSIWNKHICFVLSIKSTYKMSVSGFFFFFGGEGLWKYSIKWSRFWKTHVWLEHTLSLPPPLPPPAVGSCGRRNWKSHLVRTQSLNVLPLKPGAGQYVATCYAYRPGFLPRLFLPFRSIHLHFFQNLSQFLPVLTVANTGSCVGLQNKIGLPAGYRFPFWMTAEYK